ncbi:MAG TPA: LamG-like jellyroll fold domain-containing protein [Lacipirellulaceae bacterium]|nr:LamG-like jellyroll fold domain-containing protein [Lacipirellulaceae bacterium]
MNDLDPEFRRMLSVLLDGKLTDAEKHQLNELVRDNPARQHQYREIISLHALLYLDFSPGFLHLMPPLEGEVPPDILARAAHASAPQAATSTGAAGLASDLSATVATGGPQSVMGRPAGGRRLSVARLAPWAVAATVALASIGVWWSVVDSDRPAAARRDDRQGSAARRWPRGGAPAPESPSVAVLGQATGAKWAATGSIPNIGGALAAGEFALEEGLVQLEFLSGAAVIIEAPASFEIVSPSRLICRQGKLRAHVPAQAHGFRIETPGYAAVDLGTEFTVNVGPNGQSDFHVLDGEVELWNLQSSASAPIETLTTGRSAHTTPEGGLSETSIVPASLVGRRQLREITERAEQERYAKWRQFSGALRARPDVVLYYGLDGHAEWERELRNDGPNPDELLTGAIVGCHWTSGRWTGKQALEFKRITDRVRLTVPGEFESLTFSAWVRIEGLERWLTSLMLTDGHDANEVHWQITEGGALLLGVNDSGRNLHDYFSPKVLGPSDLGRWVHLAAVFDGRSGVVRHYLDARQISSEQVKSPAPLRLGRAEIGNWAPNDAPQYRNRSLNGRIDEFILFSSPLSGEQIREIYEAGKPGS